MNNVKIPNHIGIIVDGNGRWAKERGLSRSEGHKAGYENLKSLLTYIFNRGVYCISAYLFSTENFSRSEKEVKFLMDLLISKFDEIRDICIKNKAKIVVSGREKGLNAKVLNSLKQLEEETKMFSNHIFNVCFNYGGHAEIIDATKKIVNEVQNGELDINDLNEDIYNKYLYHELPPVDFMIRTSGENRISNFMLWQCSYAEFYFPKTYFPDFKEKKFDEALIEYTKRDRRFGGIVDENKNN